MTFGQQFGWQAFLEWSYVGSNVSPGTSALYSTLRFTRSVGSADRFPSSRHATLPASDDSSSKFVVNRHDTIGLVPQ
jgi:hypothetical protein